MNGFFRFKSDKLFFKPYELPHRQAVTTWCITGLGLDHERFDPSITRAIYEQQMSPNFKVYLWPGSGALARHPRGLPSNNDPDASFTPFEEFVRARRDHCITVHPEAAAVQTVTSIPDGIDDITDVELIE